MAQTIRAIYRNGVLELLEPLSAQYHEGEELKIKLMTHEERVQEALADILVPQEKITLTEEEKKLLEEFEPLDLGVGVSDAIVEERREGP